MWLNLSVFLRNNLQLFTNELNSLPPSNCFNILSSRITYNFLMHCKFYSLHKHNYQHVHVLIPIDLQTNCSPPKFMTWQTQLNINNSARAQNWLYSWRHRWPLSHIASARSAALRWCNERRWRRALNVAWHRPIQRLLMLMLLQVMTIMSMKLFELLWFGNGIRREIESHCLQANDR